MIYQDTYKRYVYTISKQYLYFWLSNDEKKQVNVMTSLFETAFFAFLFIVPENDILEIMRQN